MRLSLGIIIAIVLLFYWWQKDHPANTVPVKQGYSTVLLQAAA